MKHLRPKSILIFIVIIIIAISCILFLRTKLVPSNVLSDTVSVEYGIKDKTAFLIISPKNKGELHFTGKSSTLKNKSEKKIGTESYIKLISIAPSSDNDNKSTWYAPLTNESIYRWVIEFKDKKIIIQNGELVEETTK